jgi:predicted metalloprotease with PDZ domain
MGTLARNMVFAVAAMLALTGVSEAGGRIQGECVPPGGQQVPIPQLGFYSHFNGDGEFITGVIQGSPAQQVGLEYSDVIVAVNGYRLSYSGAWWDAMARAVAQGHVTLSIRDCRTGMIVYRHLNLGNPYPPQSVPKSQQYRPIGTTANRDLNRDPGAEIAAGILQIIGAALDQ